MAKEYSTAKQRDPVIIDKFIAIAKVLNLSPSTTKLTINIDDQHATPVDVSAVDKDATVASIRAADSSVCSAITFQMGGAYGSIKYENSMSSGIIKPALGNNLDIPSAYKIMNEVQRQFPPFERTEATDKLLGDELAEFYRKREAALMRLEEIEQKSLEQINNYRLTLDAERERTEQRLKEKYDAESAVLRTEHEKRISIIDEREAAVDQKTKELDDRSSRHARRQIRLDMKKEISARGQSFALTGKTAQKRILIHALFSATIIFLIVITGLSIAEIQKSTGANIWFFFAKLSVSAAATVATLIYYIRWHDNWFMRHADEEFKLKRFELDFDRASWIVEMALEWKDEEKRELPPELLKALAANLFVDNEPINRANHPYEDIASMLMGSSAEMNLTLPNAAGTLKLDRKSKKELERGQ
jgi:hypothetical protein